MVQLKHSSHQSLLLALRPCQRGIKRSFNILFCVCFMLLAGLTVFPRPGESFYAQATTAQQQVDRQYQAKDKNETQTLEVGTPLEIVSNGNRRYQVMLKAGQFLHVVVEQKGIDVVLKLYNPKNQEILRVDSPNGTHGRESLSLVAESSGNYTVSVSPLEKGVTAGRYDIALKELRMPLAEDLKRIAAERAFNDGEQLRARWRVKFQQRAMDKYAESLSLFRDIGDRYMEAMLLDIIGTADYSWNDKEKAIERLHQARNLFQTLPDISGLATVFNHLGEIYSSEGKAQLALDYHNKAYELYRVAFNKYGQAYSLNDIGIVHQKFSQYDDALKSFQSALPLWHELQYSSSEADTLRHIGATLLSLNKPGARNFYEKALQIERRVGDHLGEAVTLIELLSSFNLLGDNHSQFENYTQVLSLTSDNNWASTSDPGNGFVVFNATSGSTTQDIKSYDTALSTFHAAGNLYAEAAALNRMGAVYFRLEEMDRALKCFNKALTMNKQLDNLPELGYTLHYLMLYWKRLQNPRLAIFYGKQSVNVYQEMCGYISPEYKAVRASFLKSKEDAYRVLADLLISQKRIIEAQQVLNLLKEEEFLDFINPGIEEASAPTGRAAYTSREMDWEIRYQKLVDDLNQVGRKQNDLRASSAKDVSGEQSTETLEVEFKNANQSLDTFLKQLAKEASVKSGKDENAEIAEVKDLMTTLRELGPGVVALYTLLTDDNYSVILISPEETKSYQHPLKMKPGEFNRMVSDFRIALRYPSSYPLARARELYEILVGPIAQDLERLHAQTLMWSLDGVLRTIPMAALHDGNEYLIERYQLAVFTLASRSALKQRPSAQWRGLGFGVSKEHGDFPDLPAVSEELHGIIYEEPESNAEKEKSSIPGKIMMDEAFTEEALKQTLKQGFPVVHIASHFHFVPNNDMDSFLLLGDGSHFSLRKAKSYGKLFEGVELLTFSACDTATVNLGANGREIDGLAELAQRQGASAVVASLWPVADESTAVLMQTFYAVKKQRPELSKAAALRMAQLELLQCQDGEAELSEKDRALLNYIDDSGCLTHPYYWASFILIGNWR
jgi:CHAT domain-containing protein